MMRRDMFPHKGGKPTKKGKGLCGEDLLQFAIVSVLDMAEIVYYSIPNGVNKSKFIAWLFKMTGLKKGVPDLHLPEPLRTVDGTLYNSVYFEVKLPGKYASAEQKNWHRKLRECGHMVEVVYSLDDLFDWLEENRPEKYNLVRTKFLLFLMEHPEVGKFLERKPE